MPPGPGDARPAERLAEPTLPAHAVPAPACPTDLSIQCPTCGTAMQPEHARYRCTRCGYRQSCCM